MSSGSLACLALLLLGGIALFFVSNANSAEAARRKRILLDANDAYHGSLAELKAAPNNPDLKQKTLELGRAYSNLTRQSKGVTVYDEMALANDISAATAASGTTAPAATVAERLARIDDLKASGAITAEEHAAQRQKIVGEV
jgi:hypothetical protein